MTNDSSALLEDQAEIERWAEESLKRLKAAYVASGWFREWRQSLPVGESEAYARMRESDAAREQLRKEHYPYVPFSDHATTLIELLNEADEGEDWRIDGLLPGGALVVFAAEGKTGKTTVALNLVAALAKGTSFLGRLALRPSDGRTIVYLHSDRMPRRTFRQWASAIIGRQPNVVYIEVDSNNSLNILDKETRDLIVRDFKTLDCAVLIIDSALPLLAAIELEEDSNTDVRRWLDSLRTLKDDAGISEIVVIHHTGHMAKGRSRGASSWNDGADGMWSLTKNDNELRSFAANGRNFYVPRLNVSYDEGTHLVDVADAGYVDAYGTAAKHDGQIVELLRDGPMSVKDIQTSLAMGVSLTSRRTDALAERHVITKEKIGRKTVCTLCEDVTPG